MGSDPIAQSSWGLTPIPRWANPLQDDWPDGWGAVSNFDRLCGECSRDFDVWRSVVQQLDHGLTFVEPFTQRGRHANAGAGIDGSVDLVSSRTQSERGTANPLGIQSLKIS